MLVFKDLEHVYDSHHHSNLPNLLFCDLGFSFSLAELRFFIFVLVVWLLFYVFKSEISMTLLGILSFLFNCAPITSIEKVLCLKQK